MVFPDRNNKRCAQTFPMNLNDVTMSASCEAVMWKNNSIPFSDIFFRIVVESNKTMLQITGCQQFKPDLDVIGSYVLFMGTLISIFCSFVLLVTFNSFPEEPPFGLFCLSASLLLSDTLYIVASGFHATKALVIPQQRFAWECDKWS